MNHPFFEFPKHLHHESDPPVVAHTAEEEADARAKGYTDEYQHKEYPKHVRRADGLVVTVNSPEEHEVATQPRQR
jgi:hypothetical protein